MPAKPTADCDQPTEETPMSDRRPLPFSGRFLWHNHDHPLASDDDQFDHLPADVFGRLDGFLPGRHERTLQLVKAYRTEADAVAALERATETRVSRG